MSAHLLFTLYNAESCYQMPPDISSETVRAKEPHPPISFLRTSDVRPPLMHNCFAGSAARTIYSPDEHPARALGASQRGVAYCTARSVSAENLTWSVQRGISMCSIRVECQNWEVTSTWHGRPAGFFFLAVVRHCL